MNNLQKMKDLQWFIPPKHFLAHHQTFVGEHHVKKNGCQPFHSYSTQGKPVDSTWQAQSLVAQSRWSLYTVQILCETVRARKISRWKQVVAIHGGRWSQVRERERERGGGGGVTGFTHLKSLEGFIKLEWAVPSQLTGESQSRNIQCNRYQK